MGLNISAKNKKANYVEPLKWNNLIKDKNTFILDARKPFEYEVGSFKRAINPKVNHFREFPVYLNKLDKKKPVAMFCTGGIRCEKSTAYLKEQGFEEVYHLEGGILKYLEEVPEKETLWEGECFVFDSRVAVNQALEKGQYDQCFACRMPITEVEMQHPHYEKGVSCHHCYGKHSAEQLKRFSEREKQSQLSKQRGEEHIGSDAAEQMQLRRAQKQADKKAQQQAAKKRG